MPDSINIMKALSIALIVPDARRRGTLTTILAASLPSAAMEFDHYPSADELAEIARLKCDVIVVDLDSDAERAIDTIEKLSSRNSSATVMAYSSRNDADMLRRIMQAGAREFLIEPLVPETVREAVNRASARRPAVQLKAEGKLLVFVPSKGGVGVTTCASNFALSLTKESGAKVVVVDMDFQLGEIALGLGLTSNFSIVDALVNANRLDKDFLASLLIRHSSGLAILSSPANYNFFQSGVDDGADRLFQILREEFDFVVVDFGSCHGTLQEKMFLAADKIYLVTEATFPALRNGHRLISYLSGRDGSRAVEVVLNRFNSRHSSVDENSVTKVLLRPIAWRIPNDFAAARDAEDTGIPLAMADSPITRALAQMARAACGKPLLPEKKTRLGFSLFGAKTVSEIAENKWKPLISKN
jgi:pilus assembly protein CpaE